MMPIDEAIAIRILQTLGLTTKDLYKKNLEHFTEEARKRDEIVEGYFGKEGLSKLIEEISKELGSSERKTILDLGAGTGTFLIPVAKRLSVAQIFALDATPKMLEYFEKKMQQQSIEIKHASIIGDMEQIARSLELNRELRKLELPEKFDLVLSTLAFHHVPNTEKIIEGITHVLSPNGRAVIVDIVFNEQMNSKSSEEHAHEGFKLEELRELATKYFENVNIRVPSIKCKDSESCVETEVFIMKLEKPIR